MDTTRREENATLGGGCFWCLEAVFEQLKGVYSVESGYAGGNVTEPKLRVGLYRDNGTRGGGSGTLQPRRDLLCRFAWSIFLHPRPDDAEPTGGRRRHPVPIGDFFRNT